MVEEPNYPHVCKNAANGGNILSAMGSRYLLPLGTTKDHFDVSYGLSHRRDTLTQIEL